MIRTGLAVAVTTCAAAIAGPASAAAADPALTVPKATLDAAIHCHGPALAGAKLTPIVIVTGTGASGDELYSILKGPLDAWGHPVCSVEFPDLTTADIQVSAQYLVNAVRWANAQSKRKVAIYGISQGGLLPRWALTWWPGLRAKVDDVIAVAGTQHGTTATNGVTCNASVGCPPAFWQQAAGSNLLKALNRYPDESPGTTSWTTVYSTTDEVVQPQTGPHPTSALRGATNILIQGVCRSRKVTHIGSVLDSVAWDALVDAVTHTGPAKISRLPRNTCSHPFATGLDASLAWIVISVAQGHILTTWASAPKVFAEPALARYVK